MEKILKATQKLSERLDEFVKISEDFDRDEVEKLFKTNEIAYSNIDEVCHKISELKIVIQAEIDKYYCNRIGVLCKKGCEHRADKMSWCDRYRYNYLNLKTCYLSRKHS